MSSPWFLAMVPRLDGGLEFTSIPRPLLSCHLQFYRIGGNFNRQSDHPNHRFSDFLRDPFRYFVFLGTMDATARPLCCFQSSVARAIHLSPYCSYRLRQQRLYVCRISLMPPFLTFLVVTGLAPSLYRKRPSEAARHRLFFRKTSITISCVIAPTTACTFLHQIGNSGGWMVFGFVSGAFICSRIIEIIYAFDLARCCRHFLSLVIFLLLFSGLVQSHFDLTG